jgi:hypothetical protein
MGIAERSSQVAELAVVVGDEMVEIDLGVTPVSTVALPAVGLEHETPMLSQDWSKFPSSRCTRRPSSFATKRLVS